MRFRQELFVIDILSFGAYVDNSVAAITFVSRPVNNPRLRYIEGITYTRMLLQDKHMYITSTLECKILLGIHNVVKYYNCACPEITFEVSKYRESTLSEATAD